MSDHPLKDQLAALLALLNEGPGVNGVALARAGRILDTIAWDERANGMPAGR